jgi:hypothetical protein
MPTLSAIVEPFMPRFTEADEAVMERMMLAAIEPGSPEAFDRIVNADPAMQLTLLRWRGHLTLAAGAFYRMQTRAYAEL